MKRWFRDVILLPVLIGLGFMIWGALYSGVRWHSPLSINALKALLGAPIPLWCALLVLGVAAIIGGKGYLSWQSNSKLRRRYASEIRAHDLLLFRQAEELIRDNLLNNMLDKLQTDDSYLRRDGQQIDRFRYFFSDVSNQFIDPELSRRVAALIEDLDKLMEFWAQYFFFYPKHQPHDDDSQYCLHPGLNVDRDGDGSEKQDSQYQRLVADLDKVVKCVRDNYREYRLAAKAYLCV